MVCVELSNETLVENVDKLVNLFAGDIADLFEENLINSAKWKIKRPVSANTNFAVKEKYFYWSFIRLN